MGDIKLFSIAGGSVYELSGSSVALEVTLTSLDDLERAKPLFLVSYETS